MYITNTTEQVKKLIDEMEKLNDIGKVKFILYIFGLLNNNQINSKNEPNPTLVEDDDLIIFDMTMLGMSENACEIFLHNNVLIYKLLTDKDDVYIDNGNVVGLKYDDNELKVIQKFEKLTYNEKLDLFKELFIRYDNNTYFKENINRLTFNSEKNGFDIAREIEQFKI